ncbi:C2 domain containing protein [Histomonas meleagridis]|uniref:C2 domain containing protein n=1 Tax=Histomonas meleagridis TaxID=135588 RepID=UPI0035598820|nr:C2 domain containing protein [Histomonas meleagridis]KAH0802366.1 C2 domain containing protein [Histomonas meleagridis]
MLLHVKVIEATNLPKMSLFSKIRPRVSLFLVGAIKVKKTKANMNSDHPVWNKKFHFEVTRPTQALHLKLFGETKIGNELKDIAKYEISISTLPIDVVVDKWFQMNPTVSCKSVPNLHLQLHYAHPYIQPFSNATGYANPISNQQGYQSAYYPPPLPSIYNQSQYHQPVYQNVQQPPMPTRPRVSTYYQRPYVAPNQPTIYNQNPLINNLPPPAPAPQPANIVNKVNSPKPMYPPPPLSNFQQKIVTPNRGYAAPVISQHQPLPLIR